MDHQIIFALVAALDAKDLHRAAAVVLLTRALGMRVREALLANRSEEHTSELQSLMRISYAVFCLKKKKKQPTRHDANPATAIKIKCNTPNYILEQYKSRINT